MVLDSHRDKADTVLDPVTLRFRNFNPNILTWYAFIFAVISAWLIYVSEPWALLFAALCIFLSSLFDALDGKVARHRGTASKRGDFLDHSLDRYSDIFMIGGIALSAYCDTVIGFLGLIGVLMTSYMGTQSQAMGCRRNYRGLLGRADRMLILILLPLVQYIWNADIWLFTAMEWVMLWFAVAGNMTAVHRGLNTWNYLKGK